MPKKFIVVGIASVCVALILTLTIYAQNNPPTPPTLAPDDPMLIAPPVTVPIQINDLNVQPDGIVIDHATLPNAGIDPDTGDIYLYYTPTHSTVSDAPGGLIISNPDGLSFGEPQTPETNQFDSRNIKLPDGTFKRIPPRVIDGQFLQSMSSDDAVEFTLDDGYIYELQPDDHGWVGVSTGYRNEDDEVIWIYLADKDGLNNARMAISTDGGKTFDFFKSNVFGDAALGGGGQSFVDPAFVLLPDYRVRIFTMRMGHLYSFISTNERLTEFAFEGLQLSPSDFGDLNLTGLFDPKPVLNPDGIMRIYVTGATTNADGTPHEMILSASFDANITHD